MKKLFFLILFNLLPFLVANAAPDEVKMQLSWEHQFQFAGYYAAVEKGFYKENNLNVTLVEGGPGTVCNQDVLENQVQYCNGPGSMVKKRIDGESIVALASFVQYSPAVLLTLKGSGLLTPQDLIGKRVETMLGGEPIPEIEALFRAENIPLSKLKNKENSSGVDALVNGLVDAKYAFITCEPYQLEVLGIDYNVIFLEDYGIDLYGDALFASESELANHPKRVDAFVRASIKGWVYAMENKSEIARLILEKYPSAKTFHALIAEAKVMEDLMLRDIIEVGHINESRWLNTAKVLMAQEIEYQSLSLDGFFYKPEKEDDYFWLLNLLALCLLIALLLSLVLWIFNRSMSAEIKTRIKSQNLLSATNKRIRQQAYTDVLSGMGNRRAFYEQAEAGIKLARLNHTPLAALLIDVDHFKRINDTHGHASGDIVIMQLGAVILEIVRADDIQGRIGGEEFAILTPLTDLEGAVDLAERLRLKVESLKFEGDLAPVKLTISIGVTEYFPAKDDIHSIMERADQALYKAKNSGRNQVVISTDTPDDSFIIGPTLNRTNKHEHRTSFARPQQ